MRRDKLDILRDILTVCSNEKSRKTEITYKSNLNFAKTADYLNWLVAHELLKKDEQFYEITPAGLSLLSNLDKISN